MLYRKIADIPIGTNCAPIVADLILFCYERNFMTLLSDVKVKKYKPNVGYQTDVVLESASSSAI